MHLSKLLEELDYTVCHSTAVEHIQRILSWQPNEVELLYCC
jgi:hypothetical protein